MALPLGVHTFRFIQYKESSCSKNLNANNSFTFSNSCCGAKLPRQICNVYNIDGLGVFGDSSSRVLLQKAFIDLKRQIFFDIKTLAAGLIASVVTLLALGAWRRIDVETFLFIQILVLTFFLYLSLLFMSKKRFVFADARELTVVLIVFLVVTSTTLNIDRSRSFATLKWVSQMQASGPVSIEEIKIMKRLSPEETEAFEQRIAEQIQLGSLSETSEGVALSRMGTVIVWIAEKIAALCNLSGYREL